MKDPTDIQRRDLLRIAGGGIATGELIGVDQSTGAQSFTVEASCSGETPGERGEIVVTGGARAERTTFFVDITEPGFSDGTEATLNPESPSATFTGLDTSECGDYMIRIYTKERGQETDAYSETVTPADFGCDLEDTVHVSQNHTLTLASRTGNKETLTFQSMNPPGTETNQHSITVPACGNTTLQLTPDGILTGNRYGAAVINQTDDGEITVTTDSEELTTKSDLPNAVDWATDRVDSYVVAPGTYEYDGDLYIGPSRTHAHFENVTLKPTSGAGVRTGDADESHYG